MTKNMYDAMDDDSEGTLKCNLVEQFFREFLKGTQVEGQINTDFSNDHDHVFKILRENESGEVTIDELCSFTRELMKSHVDLLREKLEQEKYERSVALENGDFEKLEEMDKRAE